MVADIERQLVHEPLDERRAVTVEQGNRAERPFLGDAIGKRLGLGPRELTPQRVVAFLGRADDFPA